MHKTYVKIHCIFVKKGLNYGLRWVGNVKCMGEIMNTILCEGNLMINGHMRNHKKYEMDLRSRDRIAGIVTCYGLDGQSSSPCRVKNFLFSM
jgi:hypothetical protein